jgi:hypothetical protein
MVGVRKKCSQWILPPSQNQMLMTLRCDHRRTVDGSGNRVGSLQSGAACSAESPAAIRSQACCRQRRVYCPEGANQLGKTVKVFRHGWQIPRLTQMHRRRSS